MAKKRPMTPTERAHVRRVKQLGCLICKRAAEAHHITTGSGMGGRATHFETIPLCFDHHQAQTPLPFGEAVHKGTETFERKYGTQLEMLERTRNLLLRVFPQYNPLNGEKNQ